MREVLGGVVINEVEAEPLSDYVLDFLVAHRKECPYLDFKKTISIQKDSNFPELAKDFFAFSNYGGGWILVGWEEIKSNIFIPVGLPDDYNVDQASLQEKFNSYANTSTEILYKEFNRDFSDIFIKDKDEIRQKVNSVSNRFAVIYITPSYTILKPVKDGKYQKGEKERIVFEKDKVFYRRGTQNIHPNAHEFDLIKKRIEKENYRLSVLSGEPDEITEKIYSNLFAVKKLPTYIFYGQEKGLDNVSIKVLLKQEGVFPEWVYKFKIWNNNIITFEDLTKSDNVYRKLVMPETIKKEAIEEWLADKDKNRIITELLNREIKHHAIANHMFYFEEKNKFYYPYNPITEIKRSETWKSRYCEGTRTVAAKMWARQLNRFIHVHPAFTPRFIQLGDGNFFLRILPTFVITEDGKRPISGFTEGTIITSLSYNRYNNSYLNTVLFWMHQLGNGKDIQIGDYLTISADPLTTELPVGIIFDIPSSEFRLEIKEESGRGIYDTELDDEFSMEDELE